MLQGGQFFIQIKAKKVWNQKAFKAQQGLITIKV